MFPVSVTDVLCEASWVQSVCRGALKEPLKVVCATLCLEQNWFQVLVCAAALVAHQESEKWAKDGDL